VVRQHHKPIALWVVLWLAAKSAAPMCRAANAAGRMGRALAEELAKRWAPSAHDASWAAIAADRVASATSALSDHGMGLATAIGAVAGCCSVDLGVVGWGVLLYLAVQPRGRELACSALVVAACITPLLLARPFMAAAASRDPLATVELAANVTTRYTNSRRRGLEGAPAFTLWAKDVAEGANALFTGPIFGFLLALMATAVVLTACALALTSSVPAAALKLLPAWRWRASREKAEPREAPGEAPGE
jgi:hypothetical protein